VSESTFHPVFEELAALVQSETGLGWGPKGRALLWNAVESRAGHLGLAGPAAYLAYLHSDPTEWPRLAPGLVDSRTAFFRNPLQFQALGAVLDDISLRRQERRLNLLSVGCSTGEEALSLAMTAWDTGLINKNWDVRVHAADLNPEAIDFFRIATYEAKDTRAIPQRSLNRWFRPKGERWQARPELMEMISAETANLMDLDGWPWPDPIGLYDVVLAKNLLSDMAPRQAEKATRHLAELTAPDGVLFTGVTEGLPYGENYFLPERIGGTIYYRRLATKLKANPSHTPRRSATGGGRDPSALHPASAAPKPDKKIRRNLVSAAKRLAAGKPQEAVPPLETAMNLAAAKGDLCIHALGLAARAMLTLGRPDDAANLAEAVILLDVETPWANMLLGEAMAAAGKPGEAKVLFRRALEQMKADENWEKDYYFSTDPATAGTAGPSAYIRKLADK
jgi:chemotaxis protein methyltransferase CheR